MEENRKCEICGKSDVLTMVCGSSLGAFSQNICMVCVNVNAEEKFLLEAGFGVTRNHTYYVPEKDKYFYFISQKPFIFLPDTFKLETRSEYVKFLELQYGGEYVRD